MEAFEDKMQQGGGAAIREASKFFMKKDPVHASLERITRRLQELNIPYAIVGGMALVAHGYDRTTVDVDVLVTPQGLRELHQHLDGRGYLPPFEGSRHLRDTETSVRIEFLVSGEFPGDGKPKPICFPDPVHCSVEIDGLRYAELKCLIELKLASGMTNPGRLRDLADVQELIRARGLKAELSAQLDPYVREKYLELWAAVEDDPSSGEKDCSPGDR